MRGSHVSHKKGMAGKIKVFEKLGYHLFSLQQILSSVIFLLPFLSVLSVFHTKNLVLLHLINGYVTSTSE